MWEILPVLNFCPLHALPPPSQIKNDIIMHSWYIIWGYSQTNSQINIWVHTTHNFIQPFGPVGPSSGIQCWTLYVTNNLLRRSYIATVVLRGLQTSWEGIMYHHTAWEIRSSYLCWQPLGNPSKGYVQTSHPAQRQTAHNSLTPTEIKAWSYKKHDI